LRNFAGFLVCKSGGTFLLYFFDELALDGYLVIRRRRDGSCCYQHAVIVFVHYLTVLRSDPENFEHTMLDLSTFMREHMSDEELKQYILDPQGGTSMSFLREITGLRRFEVQKIYLPPIHGSDSMNAAR